MQIKSVKIKNFRCFQNLELDFEKLHVLIGENGTGKSAVLEAINFATSFGYLTARIEEQDFNMADVGNISIEVTFDKYFINKVPDGYTTQNILCNKIILRIKRRDLATGGRALSDGFVIEHFTEPTLYTLSSRVVENLLPGGISNTKIPTSVSKAAEGYEAKRKTGTVMKLSNLKLSTSNELVGFPSVFYFDRFREKQLKPGFNTLLQKIIKDLNWRYRKDWQKNAHLSKWDNYYREIIDTVEEKKKRQIIEPLQEKMKDFFGPMYGNLELSLLDIEQPFRKAFFSLRKETNQIQQDNIGSGVSILLAYFLLDVISKLTKEDIIFLIDEPELHLHPQLQQKLFREFSNSKYQIIFATQSDCFVDISEWKSVTRFLPDFRLAPTHLELEKQLEGQSIRTHLNEIKKWHKHKSIFFREDNGIFFARSCLLVEGPAEKYGLPILAQKLGVDLGDITIIGCNGKTKIPYYQLLCKAFEIPFFTVFDLDGKAKDKDDNKRPYAWARSNHCRMFRTSFENLLGVKPDEKHKTSKLLMKVDAIDRKNIPKEIIDTLIAISNWSQSL